MEMAVSVTASVASKAHVMRLRASNRKRCPTKRNRECSDSNLSPKYQAWLRTWLV